MLHVLASLKNHQPIKVLGNRVLPNVALEGNHDDR